ncbi:MAG: cation diffusion facilitator family transporter [Acidimicrobiales bacterium]
MNDPDIHHDHDHEAGLVNKLRSMFIRHSHDALDSLDQQLVASNDGMRALKVSLGVLALTALVELFIVAVSGSVALLSDSIHNFADALTAVPLGLAFWIGRKPATARYTYGYGRAEDLAGVVIVVIIAASSGFTAYEAVHRLIHPQTIHQVGLVIVAGLVGFIGNEFVARYRIRVGKKIGSAALVADGHHARIDAVTSLAVVLGAIGVALGFPVADPIIGLLITVAILGVLRTAARDIFRRLMDSVDPALVHQVESILADVDGVEHVGTVRLRWVGHELHTEAVIVSDGQRPLVEAHAIAEEAQHRLLHEVPRLTEALIHSDPGLGGQAMGHNVIAHHFTNRNE